MSAVEDTGAYRFDELGWAQFELVCDGLLAAQGLNELEWSGRADEIRVCAVERVPAALAGVELPGPTVVGVVWQKPGATPTVEALAAARVGGVLASAAYSDTRSAVLLTNARAGQAVLDDIAVLGPAELSRLIDRNPRVRREAPSLLGACSLGDLLDPAVAVRSAWDGEAAAELTRVFVPTRAYRAVLSALERHGFAVISGPPEMGKTAIARVLGLALQAEGWEVHECIRPEQVFAAYAADRPQLFIADDAFGSTEYHPDAAERWALELDRILRATDDRHWLVWTSRPAPLKAGLGRIHREHGVERFPRPAQVSVDAGSLDVEERATILLRHTRAVTDRRESYRLVRDHGREIVEHEHFTPERIRRFVTSRLPQLERRQVGVRMAIQAELAEPTAAMADSFDALSPDHRAVLVGLLDAPPGPVPERDVAAAARRHSESGLPRPPGELVDRLTDHFVRLVPPTSVVWVHPSWRDLVIDRLAAAPLERRRFLERCSLDGALLALSSEGGGEGERIRPLLGDDGDWDALGQRLYEVCPDLDDACLLRLFAMLEDGLERRGDPAAAELAALAYTTLSRVSAAWETGRSFASPELLLRWRRVSILLDDPPPPPRSAQIWDPPGSRSLDLPPEYDFEWRSAPEWAVENKAVRGRIVDRILADLDAA